MKPSIIFTDFDDTLTYQGSLLSRVVAVIEDLAKLGVSVIPVTGGCAGWCDCLVRLLPISAIIGENGSFYIEKSDGCLTYHDHVDAATRAENRTKIMHFVEQIYQTYPALKPAMDNPYRRYDYAIDFNQQVKGIGDEVLFDIVRLAEKEGITASISSIHLNLWIGHYNKLTAILNWLKVNRNFSEDQIQKECVYIGDSPNDELVFSYLKQTVGVNNINKFLPKMTHKPRIITDKEGGLGFVEWALKTYFEE